MNETDCSRYHFPEDIAGDWQNDEEAYQVLRNRFVTGNWNKQSEENSGDELYGDYEDFETGETHRAEEV